MSEPKAWDKLPGETGFAYKAFCHYLHSPDPKRGMTALFKTGSVPAPCTFNTAMKYCSRYKWSERAAAYDVMIATEKQRILQKEELKEYETGIKEMLKRQSKTAQAYGSALIKMHEAFFRRLKENPALLDQMPIGDLAKIIIRGATALPGIQEAERIAMGINPTLNLVNFDPEKMSDEELLKFISGQKNV